MIGNRNSVAVVTPKPNVPETKRLNQNSVRFSHPWWHLSFQVDDQFKKGLQGDDCTLSTILQPTHMTTREIELHDAAKTNDIIRIQKLTQDKVNVNAKNNFDRSALHWAAACGNHEVIEALISSGAVFDAKDKYGMTPVLWAAWFGHLDALRSLINFGANSTTCNKQAMNILHCASQNNHVHVITYIAESLQGFKADDVEKNEYTALHLAAEAGHAEAVEKLLEIRCNMYKINKNGQTILHLAVDNSHLEVVEKLLAIGDFLMERDKGGKTVLHVAAMNGCEEITSLLLKYGADVNSETTKEMTSLHLATLNGHINIVSLLIDHCCHLNTTDSHGNTALHIASANNFADIAQVLVDNKSALNYINKRSQSALHVCVENGNSQVAEVLLKAAADTRLPDKVGRTALHMATRGSYVVVTDMIIKAERHRDMLARLESTGDLDHEVDEEFVCLRRPIHANGELLQEVLWKLATKFLRQNDWKKLSDHWHFSTEHVKAIEHEFTGPHSYREHGYRLLMIWLCGLRKDENAVRILYEALLAIGRRMLAEQMRKKLCTDADKSGHGYSCTLS